MAVQYKVVGACAHATIDGPHGRRNQLHFRGTLLPPDVPAVEITHLLSVGLIAPVAGVAASGPPPLSFAAEGEPRTSATGSTLNMHLDADSFFDSATLTEPAGSTDQPASAEVATEPAGSTDEPPPPPPPADPEVEDKDVEAKRAAAAAKLPTDGSPPDRRHGQAVWVEYLVSRGYDYAALAKEDKKDLVDLAASLHIGRVEPPAAQ